VTFQVFFHIGDNHPPYYRQFRKLYN